MEQKSKKSNSQYLESLKQNIPENKQSNSEYLQERQYQEEQKRNEPTTSDYQNKLDNVIDNQKYSNTPKQYINQSDAEKRMKSMQKMTGTKGYMAAGIGAGLIKSIGGMAGDNVVGKALRGTTGGLYQGGMKSLSSVNKVNRSLKRQQFDGQLGGMGKLKQGTSVIRKAANLSYSANLMKGLVGGNISPTGSMLGKTSRAISSVAGKDSVFSGIKNAANVGASGGVATSGGGMLTNVANSMTSPAALAMTGLGVAGMVSSMSTNKKMRKLMVTKKTPGELERKYAKANNLDSMYKRLRAENQITPQQQLQYILLSYIEGHTSVLPKLLSETQLGKDQKKKSGEQLKGSYGKLTGISNDPKMKKHDSVLTTLENSLNKLTTKYDPISQLTSFVLTGSNPKKILEDIAKRKGLTKSELNEKDKESAKTGISTDQLRLLGINSASLIASAQSYDSKMLSLASASFDLTRLLTQETVTIRKHGFGVDHNQFNKPIDKVGLFSKIDNILTAIPGLSAGYNIVKDLILLPSKGSKFIGNIFKGGMDKIFGKEFLKLQDSKELDKELGIDKTSQVKAVEYTAVGLPTHMEKIRTLSAQQLDVQYNIFEVLKNQYELTHQQVTGQKSGFQYSQKIGDDTLQERTWDAFEQKMLTADGLIEATNKKQKLRTLKREEVFKKSLMGKMSLFMNNDTNNFITPIEDRMTRIGNVGNKISNTFTGKDAFATDQRKQEEYDNDIRSSMVGDKGVKDISLDVERKRATPDIAGHVASSSLALLAGGTALATGGLAPLLGLAATPLLKMLTGQRGENKLDEQELDELGTEGINGRTINSIQEESDKRKNLVNRSSVESSTSQFSILQNNPLLVPNKLDLLHSMIEFNFGSLLDLFDIPVEVDVKNTILESKIDSITNQFTNPIAVDVKSNVFSNYKLNGQSVSSSIRSGVAEDYSIIAAAATGGRLSPFTIVGEEGPELIIGNSVFNQKQIKEKFGIDLNDLISNPNITKLAEGGQLDTGDAPKPADNYSIFTKMKGLLFEIKDTIVNIFDFLKNKLNLAEAKDPTNNVVSIADKMKQDQEAKLRAEDLQIQNRIISTNEQNIVLLTEIEENTEPQREKSKFMQILSSIGTAILSTLGGLAPLIASGAALALMLGTDGKIGTKAVAGIVGKLLNSILTNVGKVFDKSAPELIGSIFEKSYKMFKAPIEKIILPITTKIFSSVPKFFTSVYTKFYDNFIKFWPDTVTKFKIPVKPKFIGELITHNYNLVKTSASIFISNLFKRLPTDFVGPIKPTFLENIMTKSRNFISKFVTNFSESFLTNLSKIGSNVAKIPGFSQITNLGSVFKTFTSNMLEKIGLKGASKLGAKGIGKAIGKAIPFLGLILGGYFSVKRLMNNDLVGAIGELGSGLASLFPGVGTGISLGLDIWLALRDNKREKEGIKDQEFDPKTAAGAFLKAGAKFGPKLLGIAAKGGLKTFAKRIPFLGAPIGLYFAYKRFKQGDYIGAMGEFASGLTSLFPGVGTAIGVGIDALLFMRDSSNSADEPKSKDEKFKPGWFAKLSQSIIGGLGKVKDWMLNLIYNTPVIGGFIKSFVEGTKNDFETIGKLVKIDELNNTDGELGFFDRLKSIGKSIGRVIVRGVPYFGSFLENYFFGKTGDINKDLQTAMNDSVLRDNDPGSRTAPFKQIKEEVTIKAKTGIRKIPIIGPWIANLISGEEIDTGPTDADPTSSIGFKDVIPLIGKALTTTIATGFKAIAFVGSFISKIFTGEITTDPATINKELGLPEIVDTPGNSVGFFDVITNMFSSVTGWIANKFSSINLIGPTLSNWFSGNDSNINDELSKIKLDTDKQDPTKNLTMLMDSVRKSMADYVYDIPFVGSKMASLIFPGGNYKDTNTAKLTSKSSTKDVVDALAKDNIVNKEMFGKDKIDDWDKVKALPKDQIQKLAKHTGFSKETTARLNKLAKESTVVSTPKTKAEVQPTIQAPTTQPPSVASNLVNTVKDAASTTGAAISDVVNKVTSSPKTETIIQPAETQKPKEKTWLEKRWNIPRPSELADKANKNQPVQDNMSAKLAASETTSFTSSPKTKKDIQPIIKTKYDTPKTEVDVQPPSVASNLVNTVKDAASTTGAAISDVVGPGVMNAVDKVKSTASNIASTASDMISSKAPGVIDTVKNAASTTGAVISDVVNKVTPSPKTPGVIDTVKNAASTTGAVISDVVNKVTPSPKTKKNIQLGTTNNIIKENTLKNLHKFIANHNMDESYFDSLSRYVEGSFLKSINRKRHRGIGNLLSLNMMKKGLTLGDLDKYNGFPDVLYSKFRKWNKKNPYTESSVSKPIEDNLLISEIQSKSQLNNLTSTPKTEKDIQPISPETKTSKPKTNLKSKETTKPKSYTPKLITDYRVIRGLPDDSGQYMTDEHSDYFEEDDNEINFKLLPYYPERVNNKTAGYEEGMYFEGLSNLRKYMKLNEIDSTYYNPLSYFVKPRRKENSSDMTERRGLGEMFTLKLLRSLPREALGKIGEKYSYINGSIFGRDFNTWNRKNPYDSIAEYIPEPKRSDDTTSPNKVTSTPKTKKDIQPISPETKTSKPKVDPLIFNAFDKGSDGPLQPGLSLVGEGPDGKSSSPEFLLTGNDGKTEVIASKHTDSIKNILKLPGINSKQNDIGESKFDGFKFINAWNSQLDKLFGNKEHNSDTPNNISLFNADTRNLNKNIEDVIKTHIIASEGMVLKKYKDSLGYPTIGVGHLIKPNESFPDKISIDDAKKLFNTDYLNHKRLASQLPVFNQLSDIRKGGLIDLVFNMGLGKVKKFVTTRRKLREGDFKGAAENLLDSPYAKQVGIRAQRIAKVFETDDPSYFNSNKPQIIAAKNSGILSPATLVGEKGPELIFDNYVFNKADAFKEFGLDLAKLISTPGATKPAEKSNISLPNILNKTNNVIPKLPNELVNGKNQLSELLTKITTEIKQQINANSKGSSRSDISSVLDKANKFEREQIEDKVQSTKEKTVINKKSTKQSTAPVIVNNNQSTVIPQNNRQESEGQFTSVDKSLDNLVLTLFNNVSQILPDAINDFTFSNKVFI